MAHSHLLGQAILVTFPDQPDERHLILDVTLDCPECGQHRLRIGGHHAQSLLRLLAEWVEQYPDLTGSSAQVKVVRRENFEFSGPAKDPQNN